MLIAVRGELDEKEWHERSVQLQAPVVDHGRERAAVVFGAKERYSMSITTVWTNIAFSLVPQEEDN